MSLMARKHDIRRHAEKEPVDLLIISPGGRASVQSKRRAPGCWSAHEGCLMRLGVACPNNPNRVQLHELVRALLAVAPRLERSRHYLPKAQLDHSYL